jgi:Flp pilus assembly protein TadD
MLRHPLLNESLDPFMSNESDISTSIKNEGASSEIAASRTFVDNLYQSALSAHRAGRIAEAEAGYQRVFATDITHADAIYLLGVISEQKGQKAEAEIAYRRAIELRPDFVGALSDFGTLHSQVGRFIAAEVAYRRAIEFKPDCERVLNNLGNLLTKIKRYSEAEIAYRRAIELKPDCAVVWNSLAILLVDTRQFVEAEAAYRSALGIEPDYPSARFNLSCLLLGLGRYAEAWEHFESRSDPSLKNGMAVMPHYLPFPQWRGERLAGKSLLIWAEEDCGDQIQFIRYASLLKHRGVARITVVCHPALKSLLETAAGVDTVVTNPNTVPLHDYWSLFSEPAAVFRHDAADHSSARSVFIPLARTSGTLAKEISL